MDGARELSQHARVACGYVSKYVSKQLLRYLQARSPAVLCNIVIRLGECH